MGQVRRVFNVTPGSGAQFFDPGKGRLVDKQQRDIDAEDVSNTNVTGGGIGGELAFRDDISGSKSVFSGSSKTPGTGVEGAADLINQEADEAIARLGKGLERSRQELQAGFTSRGLRRSGLASGAVADLQQGAQQKQRSIERERLGRLSQLGREALQQRAQFRLQEERLNRSGGVTGFGDDEEEQGRIFGPTFVSGDDEGVPQRQGGSRRRRGGSDDLSAEDIGGSFGFSGGNNDADQAQSPDFSNVSF